MRFNIMNGIGNTKKIQMSQDNRMSAKAAAGYLGLSVKTMAMMRCYGNGPKFVKLGRISYFKHDLDDWVIARQVSNTAQARLVKRKL